MPPGFVPICSRKKMRVHMFFKEMNASAPPLWSFPWRLCWSKFPEAMPLAPTSCYFLPPSILIKCLISGIWFRYIFYAKGRRKGDCLWFTAINPLLSHCCLLRKIELWHWYAWLGMQVCKWARKKEAVTCPEAARVRSTEAHSGITNFWSLNSFVDAF